MNDEDELGIDIEVYVKDGEVYAVHKNGEPARARVIDYDVTFPVVAHGLRKDADGEFYTETIV